MKDLTFAITCSNEINELYKLLSQILENFTRPNIVCLWDMKADISVWNLLVDCKNQYSEVNIQIFSKKFNNDFADHKNYLNSKCKTDWILQLDADELLCFDLINWLREVDLNQESLVNTDLIYIPRINIVEDITDEYAESQGWKFHDRSKDWIQWPDYQGRLYRSGLMWYGKVHERIQSKQKYAVMPEDPNLALMHHKTFERQQTQNELYSKIER